ncbi:hypothetical protein NDU88_001044 [Pleurodeles waltl]|uniref:Uncharacterized protein n=1 Tax=Pleurodeles waltl TaxID=8319 RepID=A0AAV7WLB9_PLEWA|nr:hypothetical protein NDU88_001044 [Pleurodeles waltl]
MLPVAASPERLWVGKPATAGLNPRGAATQQGRPGRRRHHRVTSPGRRANPAPPSRSNLQRLTPVAQREPKLQLQVAGMLRGARTKRVGC